LDNVVIAPSQTIRKLIENENVCFDIEWALSQNITRMSSNLSIINFAGSNIPSNAVWLPINSTTGISVLRTGNFVSPNGTFLILTKTNVNPFESIAAIPVNISSSYTIMVLKRAFNVPNLNSVYGLLSTQFLASASLVAEISLINGSLLRQFDGSNLGLHVRLSDMWDIPSSENIFIMMDYFGIICLKRNSFELIKIYKPNDGIFPGTNIAGAVLINDNTIIWPNITRKTNLTELRIWNFNEQDNSYSILLNNESFENFDLLPSYIGFDYNTGNIWITFMTFGPGEYLATSVIYHYINSTKIIHREIRWGEWLGWVESDRSQLGSLVMNDSLFVVTSNYSDSNDSGSVLIQKFIDNNHDDHQYGSLI